MVKGRQMTAGNDVTAISVEYPVLRDFTAALFEAAGAPAADAALMGEILATNDLNGSTGHGTACAADPDTGGWQGYVNRSASREHFAQESGPLLLVSDIQEVRLQIPPACSARPDPICESEPERDQGLGGRNHCCLW